MAVIKKVWQFYVQNSQNFLRQIFEIFVTLGLKILRFLDYA